MYRIRFRFLFLQHLTLASLLLLHQKRPKELKKEKSIRDSRVRNTKTMQNLKLLNDLDLLMLSNDEEKSYLSTATAATVNSGEDGDIISISKRKTSWTKKISNAIHHNLLDSFKQRFHQFNENIRGNFHFGEKKNQCENSVKEAMDCNQVGDDMAKRMNWQEAMRAWKRSLEVLGQSTAATDHRMTAMLLNKIGIAYYVQDALYFSHESFQKALKIQEAALLDPGDKDITLTLKNIWIVRVRMMEKTQNSLVRELLMMHVMNNLYVKLLVNE